MSRVKRSTQVSQAAGPHKLRKQVPLDRDTDPFEEFPFRPYPFRRNPNSIAEHLDAPGNLRSPYKRFQSITGLDPCNPDSQFRSLCEENPLRDRIKIAPVPLILPASELSEIAHGAKQQMRALSHFFADLVLGKRRGISSSGFMHPEVVDSILRGTDFRSLAFLRTFWEGRTSRDIVFLCGPDLMRDKDGQWRVLEVNVGATGGFADQSAIQRFYSELLATRLGLSTSALAQRLSLDLTDDFLPRVLEGLVEQQELSAPPLGIFSNRSGFHRGLLTDAGRDYTDRDLEYYREHCEFRRLGITTVTRLGSVGKRPSRKIPFLLNIYSRDSGLWNWRFKSHGVRMMLGPGITTLLGDKRLLPYVERMVQFYLGEEAILKPVPSYNVIFQRHPDRVLSKELAAAFPGEATPPLSTIEDAAAETFILKSPTGEQGKAVENASSPNRLRMSAGFHCVLRDLPFPLVLQPIIPGSTLGDGLVDVRPLGVAVGGDEYVVTRLHWGRWATGEFFTNVSQGAHELVVWGEPS